ncbi:MAG: FimV/HubP family polar landmark protein [Gammaproteobacteria bacterium]
MNFYKNYKLYLFFLFLLYGNLIVSEDDPKINTDEYNNLWSIGIELKDIYTEYSVYQIMISLLELNELAFENGNINFLKKGFTLNLPKKNDLEKLEALSSIREVARQNLAANVGPIDFSVLTDVLVLSEPTFVLSKEDEDTSLILDEIDIDIASTEESLNDKNRKTLITYSIESDSNLDSSEKIIVVNLSGSSDKDVTNLSKVEELSSIPDEIDLADNEESLFSFNEADELLGEIEVATELDQNNDQVKLIDIPKFEIVSDDLTTIEKNFEKTPFRDFLRTEFYLLFGFILFLVFLWVFRTRPTKKETKTLKNDEELKSDLDEEFGEIGDPIEARINLAITYIEMNQIDKANDLLSQVLESEATESQKEKARNLIKDI